MRVSVCSGELIHIWISQNSHILLYTQKMFFDRYQSQTHRPCERFVHLFFFFCFIVVYLSRVACRSYYVHAQCILWYILDSSFHHVIIKTWAVHKRKEKQRQNSACVAKKGKFIFCVNFSFAKNPLNWFCYALALCMCLQYFIPSRSSSIIVSMSRQSLEL